MHYTHLHFRLVEWFCMSIMAPMLEPRLVLHSTILPFTFSLASNAFRDAKLGVVETNDSRNTTPSTISGTAGTAGT
jgi:hypothetical protein